MSSNIQYDDPDLFAKLASLEAFREFVRRSYEGFFQNSRLKPLLSNYNLSEAFASYQKDIQELGRKENEELPLERVKQAAFMAYWLRRVSPIHQIMGSLATMQALTAREDFLLRYANEYCAFSIAYQICRYVESMKVENVDRYVRSSILDEQSESGERDVREYMLHTPLAYVLPDNYVYDVCQCMKEKNVSPHALYLMLKGLFIRLQP